MRRNLPLSHHFAQNFVIGDSECFYCGKSDPPVTHFCDEWDSYLHDTCIDAFLLTEAGHIVIKHQHEVIYRIERSWIWSNLEAGEDGQPRIVKTHSVTDSEILRTFWDLLDRVYDRC
jgi:hypothetical protein